jgi:hypothetical protein
MDSFDCNNLTDIQWVQLSRVQGLADYALSISCVPLKSVPTLNSPFNHYPRLYEFIILKNTRKEYSEEMSLKVSSINEDALYDDIDKIPNKLIGYITLHHDCAHQLHLLTIGTVSYERACNVGYNIVALTTHLFRTKGVILPVDNMIISPEAEKMYNTYTCIFKDRSVTLPPLEYDRDCRVAMRNIINMRLRIVGRNGTPLSLHGCLELVPLVVSPADPYIPLYLEFINYCCSITTDTGYIVRFCRGRNDRWFWIHLFTRRLITIADAESSRELCQQSLSNPIKYPCIHTMRHVIPTLPDDSTLINMRFNDIPSQEPNLITFTVAKVLCHRYYGDSDEALLQMLCDEIIEACAAKICCSIKSTIKNKIMKKTSEVSQRSVAQFVDDMICPHLSKIRTILQSL